MHLIKIQAEMEKRMDEQSKSKVSQQLFDEHTKAIREYLETVSHNANLGNENTKLEVQVLRVMLQNMENRQTEATDEQAQEHSKMQNQISQMHSKFAELSAEVTSCKGVQVDVGALTHDVRGVQGNVTKMSGNFEALTQNVDGMTTSISKMAGSIGDVAEDMQKLGSRVEAGNLSLQNTLIGKVENLFKEFKTNLVDVNGRRDSGRGSEKQDSSSDSIAQGSPAPRNVRHASSTQIQATLPSRTVRIQADEPDVTTVMQDFLEASNNRIDKLEETLHGNQTSMHADGGGKKAKPHKFGGEVSDGSADAWISLMRMYLEDCRGSERKKVLTLLTFLHKHAKAWIMQKPAEERDSCDKVVTLLSKRFGIGDSPNDASYDSKLMTWIAKP